MRVERNAEIAPLTTFGIPAKAAAVAYWSDADDLSRLSALPHPLKAIGGGSNLLFTNDFCGTLLICGSTPRLDCNGSEWTVSGNYILDDLCATAATGGYRGLENLSGIPGTLGGALVQNAGAYGAEIGNAFVRAELFDLQENKTLVATKEWMQFGYRTSRLKTQPNRYIILSARLRLSETSEANVSYGNLRQLLGDREPTPANVRKAVLQARAAKLPDPKTIGSAGSFFRNPEVPAQLLTDGMPRFDLGNGFYKVPAAWLIDQCGLKGAKAGGAKVWELQPLVLVNAANATAADILALEAKIISEVRNRFGILLQPEVEHIS